MVAGVTVAGGGQLGEVGVVRTLQLLVVLVVGVVRVGVGRAHGLGGVQHLLQVHDVVHGLGEDVHLGHLLDAGGGGHVLPQGLEAPVDGLHAVPLPLVPLDGLEVLLRLDGVPVDGVDSDQFGAWRHGERCEGLVWCAEMCTVRGMGSN